MGLRRRQQAVQLGCGEGGGSPAPHIQGADPQPGLFQHLSRAADLLQQRLHVGVHQLQGPTHVGGDKGAVGAPGGTEGDADIQGHLSLFQLPVLRQTGPGALHRQPGPAGGDVVLPLQLPAGLGLRGPRQHGPGGQLHRPDAGEGAPGWLAPQQGGARLVKCHLQGVLEGVVHLLRRTVQLPAPHTDRSLPHPLGPVHLGADGGPHGAAAQGEAGGVGLPLQCTALPGGIFRPLLREEGEHHLLHRVFIALRLVVIVVQIQIQLHSPPSSREKSSGRRPLSSAWPPSGRGCSSAPAPGWRWPRGRDRRGSPPSAPPAASGTA